MICLSKMWFYLMRPLLEVEPNGQGKLVFLYSGKSNGYHKVRSLDLRANF